MWSWCTEVRIWDYLYSFGSGGAGPGWLDPVILTGQLEGNSQDFLWSLEAKAETGSFEACWKLYLG